MSKPFLLVVALSLVSVACAHNAAVVGKPASGRLTRVVIDDAWDYLIDPGSRSCALFYREGAGFSAMMPVSCDELARNVPEAAKVITWVAPTPAPAEAPAPAAP